MSLTRINKTGEPQVIPARDGRLTITVPVQIKQRSGRKLVMLPRGAERPRDGDPRPIQLALARGHRWLAMLESAEVRSLRELARTEGVDSSYVSRMANLTTLAPDIIEACLADGDNRPALAHLIRRSLPADWRAQRQALLVPDG